jgi:DNA-binding NarL/FixJ family response regulator
VENNNQIATVREEEVLRLLALCYTNKEIAAQLQTNVETIAVQRAEAMKKLGLHSRIDIIRFAERQGWLGGVLKAADQMQRANL